jgi:uncharacterized Zn finger protein
MTPPADRGSGWGSADWPDGFPTARPIPVQGGLVARSTRGGIGEQWWSRRFIEVMESFEVGGRLTRGRNYARKGQVISLDVEPGEVSAAVQGSRVTPYKVRIGLARFTELVWAKAEVVLAEQAIHSARLLAGEFPPELEPVFAGIGAPLFPGRLGDLKMSCSCPDPVIPCKHLAAAFYLLAERFADDPFLILRWRGRSREALLDRLRQLRADDQADGGARESLDPGGLADSDGHDPGDPAADGRAVSGVSGVSGVSAGSVAGGPAAVLSAASALDGLDPAGAAAGAAPGAAGRLAGADPDRAGPGFWTAGDTPSLPTHPELPVDLLLRMLPAPGPGLGGSRLLAQLGPLYEHLPASAAGPAATSGSGRKAASGSPASSRPARATRRVGKPPETY